MQIILRGDKIKKYYKKSRISFPRKNFLVKSVDSADIVVFRGKTAGLVGESGCGKSTLGKCLIRLIEPDSGRIIFNGEDIREIPRKDFRSYRRRLQIVFQDPYSTLNPRRTVGGIINEIINHNKKFNHGETLHTAGEILELVGLKKSDLNRYPHEFSGGQRQRIAIAKAIVSNPEFIVCDEPVSALDVSVQSQILNLLKKIQKDYNISLLFISHDLASVRFMSDEVYVMYMGEIVEKAGAEELFKNPCHPYTHALLAATPTLNPDTKTKKIFLKGEIPSQSEAINGCRYSSRCHMADKKCREQIPPVKMINSREYKCWY